MNLTAAEHFAIAAFLSRNVQAHLMKLEDERRAELRDGHWQLTGTGG